MDNFIYWSSPDFLKRTKWWEFQTEYLKRSEQVWSFTMNFIIKFMPSLGQIMITFYCKLSPNLPSKVCHFQIIGGTHHYPHTGQFLLNIFCSPCRLNHQSTLNYNNHSFRQYYSHGGALPKRIAIAITKHHCNYSQLRFKPITGNKG